MWQPAAEDNSVLGLSHPGHKRNMENLRGSIASSAAHNGQPRAVFNLPGQEEGGRVWDLGQNIQDGKLLSFTEAITSLRDGEALKGREEEDSRGRLWLAGPHPAVLPKTLTLGNGVGRCPALMGEIRQLCLEMSGQRLNATCWKKKLLWYYANGPQSCSCWDGGPVPANYGVWGMHPMLLPVPAAMQFGGAGACSSLPEARNSSLHFFCNMIFVVQSKQCLF